MSIPTSPEHTPAMEEEIEVIAAGNFSTHLLAPDRPFRPSTLGSVPLPEELTIMAGGEAPRQYLSDPRSTEPSEVYDMSTPGSLLNKLCHAGMGRYLDYYARRDCGMDPNGSDMPAFVREEVLVDCTVGLDRERTKALTGHQDLRQSLEAANECTAEEERRARRAELRADVMKDALDAAIDEKSQLEKRTRKD
jgi:hypothetical protein